MDKLAPPSVKIKLKCDSVELEYEGDSSFFDDKIQSILKVLFEFSQKSPLSANAGSVSIGDAPNEAGGETGGKQIGISTVAAYLNVKTCPDLVLAALAQIEIIQGGSGATRDEVLAQMKTATGYFKKSMRGGNLSQAFETLTKAKKVNDNGGGRYSLSSAERKTLEAKLAAV